MFSLIPIAMTIIAASVAVTLMGFSKALISSRLGDPLPKRDKRITLNPLSHIEIIGLFLLTFFYVGWGKPISTAAIYYKNRKAGILITHIAPTIILILFGVLVNIASFHVWAMQDMNVEIVFYAAMFLNILSIISINLAIFNMLPIPPMDGYKVLTVFLRPNQIVRLAGSEKILQLIMVILIVWPGSPLMWLITYLRDIVIFGLL